MDIRHSPERPVYSQMGEYPLSRVLYSRGPRAKRRHLQRTGGSLVPLTEKIRLCFAEKNFYFV
ncbi:hypothetical protein DXA36_23000 [Eisenbergiella sp. OF01-20]|nr:hypothetical protein DXA36_23000 [Eisenbergiella sp. OF01-20]